MQTCLKCAVNERWFSLLFLESEWNLILRVAKNCLWAKILRKFTNPYLSHAYRSVQLNSESFITISPKRNSKLGCTEKVWPNSRFGFYTTRGIGKAEPFFHFMLHSWCCLICMRHSSVSNPLSNKYAWISNSCLQKLMPEWGTNTRAKCQEHKHFKWPKCNIFF